MSARQLRIVTGFVGLLVIAAVVYAVVRSSSDSSKGLKDDQVRPTLLSLPLQIHLRQVPLDGTKTAYIGSATRPRDGARVGFGVSICDDRQCPDPAVPAFPGADPGSTTIGTGWAFDDNATTPGFGHSRGQGISIASEIFLALCHAGNDEPCY